MAIQDDFSVAVNGDIRYVGTTDNYTVIAFHRWLGDLMDDAAASGNDILDITDSTASERSTDNIITLKYPFNIDDTASQHLYDGSIIQSNTSSNLGEVIYDGILVFANAGAYLQVIQNGVPIAPNFWTTGLNADSINGISHRFMLKVRTGGVDIDGRRIIGQTREFGSTYSEFKINGTSRGNNVMALTYASDLNNQTSIATVKGWTTITNNIEGYKLLDVNNDSTTEPYYSEWNRDTLTINQFYERAKWLSRRSTIEDSCAETGDPFQLANATIIGQAQSFSNGVVPQYLTRVKVKLRKVGAPTGNLVAKLYDHSGSFGSSSIPTGAALATSNNLDIATLTTSYLEYELAFPTPYLMLASTNYCIAFERAIIDGSNYIELDGDSTGTHAGNRSQNVASSWSVPSADDDLWFQCFASPKMYGITGEAFRGITHEINIDTTSGIFNHFGPVVWPTGLGQMYAINTTSNSGTKMWVQMINGVPPVDNQVISGVSGATCQVNATVTERTLSFPFIGQSTGSALIGAYGVGLETADLSASDKLFDLTNTQRIPPNNVTFTVNGILSGEDRVLVGPESGGILQVGQFTLNGALTGAAVTAVVVNGAIPSDTPSSGTIRVLRNSGIYSLINYSSFTGSTFTITSTDFSSDNASNGNNVFISYIDKMASATSASFTVVYNANRALFVRVRDGQNTPTKTFETTATLGSAGGSATAIRTSDL